VAGSILALPFADASVRSLSCLHVIEHMGLGRYGDPLDPVGTSKAEQGLVRVLAPGGSLFLATPVGYPRVCFNAHRIISAEAVREMFSNLDLVEFSSIHNDARFAEHLELSVFKSSKHTCGLFWFQKPN